MSSFITMGVDSDRSPRLLDTATDLTSFTLPDDNSPITIATTQIPGVSGSTPLTSLLIEYCEGGKSGDKGTAKPSIRVKITPGAKKVKPEEAVRITKIGTDRKPTHTRRILLGNKDTNVFEATDISRSSGSNQSLRPVEVELLNNSSDMSNEVTSLSRQIQLGSDFSSMPAESMLEGPTISNPSGHQSSHTTEGGGMADPKLPKVSQSPEGRSLSQCRLADKVMDKLRRDVEVPRARAASETTLDSQSKRTIGDLQDVGLGNNADLHKSKDCSSSLSNTSRSSYSTDPKLRRVVEDALRRLVLPKIEEIKRQQSIQGSRAKRYDTESSLLTESSLNEHGTNRGSRLGRVSSEPQMRSDVVREGRVDVGAARTHSQRRRRSSKEATSHRRTSDHETSDASLRCDGNGSRPSTLR